MNELISARVAAQAHTIKHIEDLVELGFSMEAIAIGMAEHLGGINPSARTIKRWSVGKGIPNQVNGLALAKLYNKVFGHYWTGAKEEE